MSLPQEPAFSLIKNHFNIGWKNIKDEDYVGSSHGYTCENAAVGTTNGAGPKNTQIFVLSPDGVVLHCLPGFWHPADLAHELRFAQQVHRLWKDKRSRKDKKKMYARLHDAAIRLQPRAMKARSGWQGFDAQNERQRLTKLKKGRRDTFYYSANGKPGKLKPISVLLHERMAARPFKTFKRFDTASYVDYGRPYYDNNAGVEGRGVQFGGKAFMASQKRKAERDKKRAERKAKSAKYYGKKTEDTKSKKRGKQASKQKTTSRKSKKKRPTSRPTSRPSKRSKRWTE